MIIKACIDTIVLFTVGWRTGLPSLFWLQLAWVTPFVLLVALLIRVMAVSLIAQRRENLVSLSIGLVLFYFLLAFAINTCQSLLDDLQKGVFITCKQQLVSYALLLYALRAYQTRCTTLAQCLFVVAYSLHTFMNAEQGYSVQSFAEIFAFIGFIGILTQNSYVREMSQRKQFNNERIIDIEIEKTEDLLSKLVPFHVLSGIKQDQRVVDILDNVTLLYTDMVGFTAFSNNVKNPVEVV